MDFSYLLDLAKKNEENAKEAIQIKRYSTQVSAAKKDVRSGVQSEAIRNFLASKELEEKQKKIEALKKKEKLLSLRAQDRKSHARVQAMLKRTKAANKAVLDEARNHVDTAVTAAGLDMQPDEDDYGYASQEASEFYKKLVGKYSAQTPVDNSIKQTGKSRKELNCAKDRVKNALDKITEEESSGHRKRRTMKPRAEAPPRESKVTTVFKEKKNELPKKVRPKGAPPEATLSFDEILKLAATKQHEPVKIEKKPEAVERKTSEKERLMTKKEKEELQRRRDEERDRQLRKEGKLPPLSATKPPAVAQPTPTTSKVKPPVKPTLPVGKLKSDIKPSSPAPRLPEKPAVKGEGRLSMAQQQRLPPQKNGPGKMGPPPNRNVAMSKTAPRPPMKANPQREPLTKGKALASRPFPPHRETHPQHPIKRRMESDEEEEEDSELDDFIDDGPEEGGDVSKYIKEIFNYDRSRYRRIESDTDDEECMESNFAQQMQEERISTKIGILEDLEEERLQREEEMRKKKTLKKKAKTKN